MARSRSRGGASKARGSSRQTSSRRKSAPAAAETDEVEDESMDVDALLAISTAVLLIVAILFLDYELGTTYGSGVFF